MSMRWKEFGSFLLKGFAVFAAVATIFTAGWRVGNSRQPDSHGDGPIGIQSALAQDVIYDDLDGLTANQSPVVFDDMVVALNAYKHREVAAALDASQELVTKWPENFPANVLRAFSLELAWSLDMSLANLNAFEGQIRLLTKMKPDNPYGDVFAAFRDLYKTPKDSVATLDKVLRNPNITPRLRGYILAQRSQANVGVGDTERALEDLNESLRLRPADAETLIKLSRLERRRKEYARAIRYANLAVLEDPTNWKTHETLAVARSYSGELGGSLTSMETSCKMSKGIQRPCAAYAVLLQQSGKFREASEAAAKAAALHGSAEGALNLACYWGLMKDEERVYQYLDGAVGFGLADSGALTEQDPNDCFNRYRGQERFGQLVEQVRRRAQTQ